MRKLLMLGVFILLLPTMAVSGVTQFGAGAFGGINIPLIQDDQGSGTAFGVKAIISGLPVFTYEPFFVLAKNGDPEVDIAGVTNDLEGSKITAFGIDAKLGALMGAPGMHPYFFAGLGFYKATRDQTSNLEEEGSDFGFGGGLGLAIGLSPSMALDLRAKLNVVPTEGGSSDKAVWILGGLNFYFGAK